MSRLIETGTDLSDVMRPIAGHLLHRIEESFETETAPDGTPWAELSEKTVIAKKKKGYSSKKLVREGNLSGRLLSDWSKRDATAGTNVVAGKKDFPYGTAHQFGSNAKNIPARPFLGIANQDEQLILKEISKKITSQWR